MLDPNSSAVPSDLTRSTLFEGETPAAMLATEAAEVPATPSTERADPCWSLLKARLAMVVAMDPVPVPVTSPVRVVDGLMFPVAIRAVASVPW